MKRLVLLLTACLAGCGEPARSADEPAAPAAAFPLAPPEARNYAVTFEDNFDAPISLRLEKAGDGARGRWNQRYWYGAPGWHSSHDDHAQGTVVSRDWHGHDLLSQTGGVLFMRGDRRPAQADPARYGDRPYVNSLLTTQGSFAQRYGYFEARLRAPPVAGYWPTFWMWCLDDSGEIDIAEFQTRDQNAVWGSTHQRTSAFTFEKLPAQIDRTDMIAPAGFRIADWHTYGLLWTPEKLEWVIDGKVRKTYADHPFHAPCFLILSNGPGGWSEENRVVARFGASLEVDYVRVGAPQGTVAARR